MNASSRERPARGPFALALSLTLIACASSAPRESMSSEGAVPGLRLDPAVRPLRYALTLDVDPRRPDVQGTTHIDLDLAKAETSLVLHGRGLGVSKVSLRLADGTEVPTRDAGSDAEGRARFEPARPVGPGRVVLEIEHSAQLTSGSSEGAFVVDEDGERYVFTQFEATMARRVFPCFDEPAFKVPFDLTLVVPKDDAAIANTPIAEETPLEDGKRKRVRFETTAPLPTYLLAFFVGPFDVVSLPDLPPTRLRPRPLPLRGVSIRGKGKRLAYALAHTPPIVTGIEEALGVAYPYPKLDLIAMPGAEAAMENAGAATFREFSLLLDPDHAPFAQRSNFTLIVAHELAHQWFGDLVTMPWWDDLWLNEALATWMEYRVVQGLEPAYRADLQAIEAAQNGMHQDSLAAARRIREPIRAADDIINAFDGITYDKGLAVLMQFERELGPDVFRRGLHGYLEAHRFGVATTADLLAALDEASGRDVSSSFSTFLDQPGVPLIAVTPRCTERGARVALAQSRYLPLGSKGDPRQLWKVPLCFRFGVGGKVERRCAMLTKAEDELELTTAGCPSWIFPNAEAAGYYRFQLPAADYERLLEKGWPELSDPERMALADSIEAAFSAGQISAEVALRSMRPFAASDVRAVAEAPLELYGFMDDHLIGPEQREAFTAHVRAAYGKTLARVEQALAERPLADRGELGQFRRDLVALLAERGRDPALRAELVRMGMKHLQPAAGGKGGDIDPDLVEVALGMSAQDGPLEHFRAITAAFKQTRDPTERRDLGHALGRVTEPTRAEEVRSLMLDPGVRGSDAVSLLWAEVEKHDNVEPTWDWLVEHFDALKARVSSEMMADLGLASASLCTPARLAEVRAELEPRLRGVAGGPRIYRQAIESIELCIARVEAHRESARRFFGERSSQTD